MAITKVWIEDGCIACRVCEDECSDVFLVGDDNCTIKTVPSLAKVEDAVKRAAENCPVEVIKFS